MGHVRRRVPCSATYKHAFSILKTTHPELRAEGSIYEADLLALLAGRFKSSSGQPSGRPELPTHFAQKVQVVPAAVEGYGHTSTFVVVYMEGGQWDFLVVTF